MAGAMTAMAEDASAIFHNPAGMVGQKGTQIQLVGSIFIPNIEFFRRPVIDPNDPNMNEIRFDSITNSSGPGVAPYLGVVSDLGSKKMAVGAALTVPFGAAISYPADGSQRHVITAVDLKAIHLSAAAAYKVTEAFRFGVSVNYILSEIKLEQGNAIPFVTGDPETFPEPDPGLEGDTLLEGHDTFSLSATLGALYVDPKGRFNVGVSALTPVTLEMKGDANVTNSAITPLLDGDGNEIQPGGQRHDEISVKIPLPLILRAGVMVKPHDRVKVAFDVNWQRWSVNKQLVIDFKNEHELLPTPGAELIDVIVENQWKDTFSVRLGTEVQPIADNPFRVRGGVLFDQSPIDDQHFDLLAPDSDKVGVSIGIGHVLSVGKSAKLELDLVYQHLFFAERNVSDSAKTILNKPAPSFYNGVTRTRFDLVYIAAGLRL